MTRTGQTSKWALTFLLFSMIVILCAATRAVAQEKTTLIDLAGREVSLELPVNTVVLPGWSGSGNPFYTLFALMGEDALNTIVGMDQGLRDYRHWIWNKFTERHPELSNIPDVGRPPEINVERIISLRPDVVLLPMQTFASVKDSIILLEKAGIPVVLNDYHAQTLKNHVQSIELIGKLTGRQDRALELIEFYKKQCAIVEDRLAAKSPGNPRVYIEVGTDHDEYQNTYGNAMWGALAFRAGGDNIALGVIERWGPASPEFVLKSAPEVIVLTGSNWPERPRSLMLGYNAVADDSRDRLDAFLARPGWSGIDAVKNRRVHGIHHGLAREIWDFYALQSLAKWFHPELFADLDPLENFKLFHEEFLGIEYSGTWAIDQD